VRVLSILFHLSSQTSAYYPEGTTNKGYTMSETPRIKHNYGKINKEYGMFLATRPPEEDGPIYMVNLMKYHEVAQYLDDAGVDKAISGREADDRYNPAKVLNKIGADIVFAGDVLKNHVGTEDWDRIAVVRYATRKSFIDMQSRPDFGEKHVHKAAGMQRTIIVCCRPENEAIDKNGRPDGALSKIVVMVVRQTPDRTAAFAAIPGAANYTAEGTIIGDERRWDTVQFLVADSEEAATAAASQLQGCEAGSSYVMTLRVSLDAMTSVMQ
jgi:hypothetical protein